MCFAIIWGTLSLCFKFPFFFHIFVGVYSHLKNELQDIISGKVKVRFGEIIQTVASYLGDGAKTGPKAEGTKQIREQETKRLEDFISKNNLWVTNIDFSQYVSEGAEQKVYLKDTEYVLKLNDGIYYSLWLDYFVNLLLHNYFFSDTAYELKGFTKDGENLYAVVQQAFITSNQNTDIEAIKVFLRSNGFVNTRNNDYINSELGIILEDLHDENVLTEDGILYFIDTVFYLTDNFWSK